jgi:hypothetical protein
MPYIGQEAATTYSTRLAVQQFNGDGSTTAFTLNQSVSADQDILVSVDGVVQDTSAYTVSNGTTLTFSPAPSSGTANIFVNYLGLAVGTVTHPATQGLTATTGAFSSTLAVTGASTLTGNTTLAGTLTVGGVSLLGAPATFYVGDDGGSIGAFLNETAALPLRFLTSGTERMRIDATGAVTMPAQPAFLARPTSNQDNIATSTDVTVVLGTEVFDQNADFASNLFTAPVAGRYQFSFSLNLRNVDSAADYYEAQIVTSNRNYNFIQDPDYGQDSVYFSISGSALCDMDASDTARFKIVQAGGTAQTDISTESHFSGYLAC